MNNLISRRRFVKFSSLLLLPSCIHKVQHTSSVGKSRNLYLLTNAPEAAYGKSNEFVVTPPGSIEIFDSESKTFNSIKIDFFGHTVLHNTINTNLIYSFVQYGVLGAIIDIEALRCHSYIKASADCTFMGHAGFIEKSSVVYTTEHDHKNNEGLIVFRDSLSLKEIHRIHSGGKKPHDTTYLKNNDTIVVINAHGPSSLAYLNAHTGTMTNKVLINEGVSGNYAHFEISDDGWVIALPRRSKSRVNLIDPFGEIYTLEHPNTKSPGVLSSCFIRNSNYVVITYPESNFIQIWNYKAKQSIANVKINNPRGIAQIESAVQDTFSFLVSSADSDLIFLFMIESNQNVSVKQFHVSFGGKGSHLIHIKS